MSYTDYLNAEIAERKIITYRTLSRQQQKHVNVAKQMLWEFYEGANKKEPGSVHATYLITGYRERPVEETVDEGGDTIMDASPPSGQGVLGEMKAIIVCPEEKLEETKKSFLRISSIHIYSVEPNKIKDINIIVGACEEFLKAHLHNSYDDRQKGLYGTIRNKEAKPRVGRAPVVQAASSKPAVAAPTSKAGPKATPTPAPSSAKTKQISTASMFAKKPVAAKKQDSQPSEPEPEPEPAKKPAAKKGPQQAFFSNWKSLEKKTAKLEIAPEAEPEAMKIDTDSEGDDEAEPEPPKQDIAEESRKRKAKQQELEAMMESDDDEPPPPKKKVASPSPPPEKEEKPEPVKEEPRRRRGKRKVTKKVTTKDEEGYLVTKTETTWESYSEDETAPPPPAPKPKPAPAKAVKKATGQGNIMSFFQKK
ncbi:Similar to DNA polymerase delta subunit 3; acc. no. Q9EQ28 [Pyronema omphalodes CBS 100304]|uniref:DNA polymerase delta subunit 3 n=1 Tax=Pyronema omphalodes (strain CBS 100304) TaxID=1076935 RepID=U4LCI6_PYROM|nr:Similar to DNA polymerase delta subunit 3; acc. no. Q9EQ28 [Pyronema omphalodes CBS 100304]